MAIHAVWSFTRRMEKRCNVHNLGASYVHMSNVIFNRTRQNIQAPLLSETLQNEMHACKARSEKKSRRRSETPQKVDKRDARLKNEIGMNLGI